MIVYIAKTTNTLRYDLNSPLLGLIPPFPPLQGDGGMGVHNLSITGCYHLDIFLYYNVSPASLGYSIGTYEVSREILGEV